MASEDLAQRLETSAKATGEKLWRMPLEDGPSVWHGQRKVKGDAGVVGSPFLPGLYTIFLNMYHPICPHLFFRVNSLCF